MRCCAEGGQGCMVGLPQRHPSARARRLLSPCLRPLRAGRDPRGGGCPWERTTREKDPQSWGPVSGGFQGHRCLVAGESDQGGMSPKPAHGRPLPRGRQLGGCCPVLPPCEALPLPVPQFPHTAMLPAGGCSPVPPPSLSITGAPLPSPWPPALAALPRPPLPSTPLWTRPARASAAFSPYINKNFTARWQEMHFQFICCSY